MVLHLLQKVILDQIQYFQLLHPQVVEVVVTLVSVNPAAQVAELLMLNQEEQVIHLQFLLLKVKQVLQVHQTLLQ